MELPRHAHCTGHLEAQFRVGHEGRVEPCPPCGLCLIPDLIEVLRIPCVGVGGCVLQVGVRCSVRRRERLSGRVRPVVMERTAGRCWRRALLPTVRIPSHAPQPSVWPWCIRSHPRRSGPPQDNNVQNRPDQCP